jgi:hypothetical protein
MHRGSTVWRAIMHGTIFLINQEQPDVFWDVASHGQMRSAVRHQYLGSRGRDH